MLPFFQAIGNNHPAEQEKDDDTHLPKVHIGEKEGVLERRPFDEVSHHDHHRSDASQGIQVCQAILRGHASRPLRYLRFGAGNIRFPCRCRQRCRAGTFRYLGEGVPVAYRQKWAVEWSLGDVLG